MLSRESLGTLRTSNFTPFCSSFSNASTSSCPIDNTLLTTTLPTECAIDPTFNSLMSTPPSTAVNTSSGFSNKSNALVFPKRGSFATSIILLIGITFAFTPGGAACSISLLRRSSFDTASETTIIRFGCTAFVQAVATCPCNRRESTRANTISIFPSPTTVPSGSAPLGCASSTAAFGASAGSNSSGFTFTPSFAVSIMCAAIL